MRVVVKDASVIIDLANADILKEWFLLGYETHTSDLILNQLQQDQQWSIVKNYFQNKKFKVHSLSPDKLTMAISRIGSLGRGGIADMSVLLLAEQLNATLLTGDGRLRSKSEKSGLEVRGTLWVLDELVRQSIITRTIAFKKLEIIIAKGARLPESEIQKRKHKWS